MNASSDDEGNNNEVAPDPPTNDVNTNTKYDDQKNGCEVTPDTPTNAGNKETIDNGGGKTEEEAEKETDN